MTRAQRIAVALWRRQHIRREIAAVLRSSWRDFASCRITWRGAVRVAR